VRELESFLRRVYVGFCWIEVFGFGVQGGVREGVRGP
jgi:hypothetical protein